MIDSPSEPCEGFLAEEDRRKQDFREARNYNFSCAWWLSKGIFFRLEDSKHHTFSSISRIISRSYLTRVMEITTFTPWIPKDGIEMRATKIQRQKLPTELGRLVLQRQQPQEAVVAQFTLDYRPAGNSVVMDRHAVIERGDQPNDRIYFPSSWVPVSLPEEQYDAWRRKDIRAISDLSQIFHALHE